MPPKHSGNAGSSANNRSKTSSSTISHKKEQPAGAHNNHGPRSDGRSAHGSNARPNARPESRPDARSNAESGARVARGFSQRKPAQPQAAKPDARQPAKPAAPSSPQTAADADVAIGVRLNKAIAATGLCSRRKADELILSGRVSVDGKPEPNPGRQVLPFESIAVDGRVLAAPQSYTYLMLNKPVHVVCTVSDPEGRPTVLDCLPPEYKALRLYPVGRLDYFSEGLLLLTNDGQLAQRLTHPRHHQPKTYEVLVRGAAPEGALKTMRRGMRLAEGEDIMPVDVTAQPVAGNTLLQMVLRQGLNRQIRRMCRDLGLTILRLCRVAQGALRLGDLASGKARPLTDAEVARLRESAGLPAER